MSLLSQLGNILPQVLLDQTWAKVSDFATVLILCFRGYGQRLRRKVGIVRMAVTISLRAYIRHKYRDVQQHSGSRTRPVHGDGPTGRRASLGRGL